MRIIQYVYFEKPGEKEQVLEIAKKSIDKVDMAGRIISTFNLELADAQVVADKFINLKKYD